MSIYSIDGSDELLIMPDECVDPTKCSVRIYTNGYEPKRQRCLVCSSMLNKQSLSHAKKLSITRKQAIRLEAERLEAERLGAKQAELRAKQAELRAEAKELRIACIAKEAEIAEAERLAAKRLEAKRTEADAELRAEAERLRELNARLEEVLEGRVPVAENAECKINGHVVASNPNPRWRPKAQRCKVCNKVLKGAELRDTWLALGREW